MPELPEVETVKETLKKLVLNRKIINVKVNYENILANKKKKEFIDKITNQTIIDIKRRGKWLMFELDNYYLLSHLRMEGRYYYLNKENIINKHEHIIFYLDNEYTLRYKDVRKFGRMYLINKDKVYEVPPLNELGLEPWDNNLNVNYLKGKYKNKRLPIKTVLLDQSIISGIGNIYADEILFYANINPYKKALLLKDIELNNIIINTKLVLEKAILLGGTTIKSYESSQGVTGLFQNELKVHSRKGLPCYKCGTIIEKEFINQRGTYYCKKCQRM